MVGSYQAESAGFCPHCQKGVMFVQVEGPRSWIIETRSGGRLAVTAARCPVCLGIALTVTHERDRALSALGAVVDVVATQSFLAWPRSAHRPVPEPVPKHIAADYTQAALVLDLSPKASAALSRRCLQSVLREAAAAQQHNLSDQINAVIQNLPTYIADNIDAIRNIGNFAAHPMKNTNSGTIVDVAPGEAEWNLDVLDSLFEFYYVQPAVARAKRDALDAKLEALGKRPMKKP